MKTKQKSVRVFEIISNNYEKVVNFVKRREVLLKKYLLIIKTNNEEIKKFFKDKEFEVRFVKFEFEGSNESIEEEKEEPIKANTSENSTKIEIFDKIIRSGFEIKSDNKLIFLKNINDGAKIYSSKEIEIFGEVFGSVVCDGEYMIVNKAKKGTIIFNNTELGDITKLSIITKDGIKGLL